MQKNIWYVIAIVLIGGVLAYTILNKEDYQKEIKEYVNNNYEELENVAKEYLTGNTPEYDTNYITDIKVSKNDDNDIVSFYVTKKSTYYGFYYSTKNTPVPYENKNVDLIQTGTGQWIWSKTGDGKGKTGQIRDNWFYFEMTKEK